MVINWRARYEQNNAPLFTKAQIESCITTDEWRIENSFPDIIPQGTDLAVQDMVTECIREIVNNKNDIADFRIDIRGHICNIQLVVDGQIMGTSISREMVMTAPNLTSILTQEINNIIRVYREQR